MNLTSQQYIIALAQEGSFTGAARRLGVSQPGLCGWLDNLEEQLGTRLVLRSRKGITLTPAGQIYLNGSRRMLSVQQRTAAALATILTCTTVISLLVFFKISGSRDVTM